MPKVLPFPEHAQARVIKQQATATIQHLIDAVVELVTNSDDSYSRIESPIGSSFGKIEIYVTREKGGRCKEFKIRDYAEGMGQKSLEEAIIYGGESSGFAEGKTVRGLLGRGLKESILGLGEGEIYTRKNGKLNCVKIWYDKEAGKIFYDFLYNFDEGDSEVTDFINSQENGTFIRITVHNEQIKIPESDKFAEQIANHYALRDINCSKKREIILNFESFGRPQFRGTTIEKIKFTIPEGDIIINKPVSLPNFGDTVQLKIWESSAPLFFQRYNPCSKAGILIKTKGAILDNQLFSYANDPAAFYFWGEAFCEGIAHRLKKAAREGKESEIINLTRKGLNWPSDYCLALQRVIEKYLSPLIQEKKKELEVQKKERMHGKTKKMLEDIRKLLNKLALKEFKEWEGPMDDIKELEIDRLTIIPSRANIEIDEPRALSIYAPKTLIESAGTRVSIMSELPDIKIMIPGSKRLTLSWGIDLTSHPKNSDLFYGFFKVRGKELGKETFVYCKLGSQEAMAHLVIKPQTKRRRKKGGFIKNIDTDGRLDPTQRVAYKEKSGEITIFVNFPGINKYLTSGLKEVEESEESKVMLAELIGEAFCNTLARRKIEGGGFPSINPESQVDDFLSEVNNIRRKYLNNIHEAILNWKSE